MVWTETHNLRGMPVYITKELKILRHPSLFLLPSRDDSWEDLVTWRTVWGGEEGLGPPSDSYCEFQFS